MSCRGMHFALEEKEVQILRATEDEEARIEHVTEVIEQDLFGGDWAAETDKAWDAIHRCFANGTLALDGGEYPLNHVILGGEQLVTSGDYYISLKTPDQVRDIAKALGDITRDNLRARYRAIDPTDYGMDLSDEDEEYTCDWFEGLVDFYRRAAETGRWVIFTVDQ